MTRPVRVETLLLFDRPKTVAALAALLGYPLSDEQAALTGEDPAHSDRIATDWTIRIQRAFVENGKPLSHP